MDGDEKVRLGRDTEFGQGAGCGSSPPTSGEQRIDHDVARLNGASEKALGGEVRHRSIVRGEEEIGSMIDKHAVDFLGHGTVEAAKAGLDMDDGDAELGCGEGAGECGIGVAKDDDNARPVSEEVGFEALKGAGGHGGVGAGANTEVVMGLGDAEFAEEAFRHPLVVMLAGMDDALIVASPPGLGREGGELDELRAGTDHGGDSHEMSEADGGDRCTQN